MNKETNKIFFTSDTHFGAERTLKLSKRPFSNVEEMDNKMVENWNKIVSKNDIVYHIGDFGNYEILKKLNGKVVLVLGNYEKEEMKNDYNNNFEEFSKKLKSLGFTEVYKDQLEIEVNGQKMFLTHRPVDCKKDMFNLFGHIHQLCMIKKYGVNVGMDCLSFSPFSLDDVMFYKSAIEKYYDENVFD